MSITLGPFVLAVILLIVSGVCAFLNREKSPLYYAFAAAAVWYVLGGRI